MGTFMSRTVTIYTDTYVAYALLVLHYIHTQTNVFTRVCARLVPCGVRSDAHREMAVATHGNEEGDRDACFIPLQRRMATLHVLTLVP